MEWRRRQEKQRKSQRYSPQRDVRITWGSRQSGVTLSLRWQAYILYIRRFPFFTSRGTVTTAGQRQGWRISRHWSGWCYLATDGKPAKADAIPRRRGTNYRIEGGTPSTEQREARQKTGGGTAEADVGPGPSLSDEPDDQQLQVTIIIINTFIERAELYKYSGHEHHTVFPEALSLQFTRYCALWLSSRRRPRKSVLSPWTILSTS